MRYGHTVTDADMVDHACVREVSGEPTLIAIEILARNDKSYAPVENPLSTDMLGKYFEYDGKKEYKEQEGYPFCCEMRGNPENSSTPTVSTLTAFIMSVISVAQAVAVTEDVFAYCRASLCGYDGVECLRSFCG